MNFLGSVPTQKDFAHSTAVVKRYRTPKMVKLSEERARATEKSEVAANKAYASFLTDIIDNYGARLRDVINRLAMADCLQSFATTAKQHRTYVRPVFTEDDMLDIVGGRHPIVETLLERPCIANSIRFGGPHPGSEPCKIITGPNMGGKSSTAKMVALIAVMAQVGSFVPAEAVTMGILDGIMTRMGGAILTFRDLPVLRYSRLHSFGRTGQRAIDVHGRDGRDKLDIGEEHVQESCHSRRARSWDVYFRRGKWNVCTIHKYADVYIFSRWQ